MSTTKQNKKTWCFMDGSQKAANVPHAGETGHSSFIFCQIWLNCRLLNSKLWSCWKGNYFDESLLCINMVVPGQDDMSWHFKIHLHERRFIIPPPPPPPPYTQRSCCWGVYWFHSVRPSVCPSVRLSRIPCPLCSTYSFGWIHFIFIHLIKQLQKVCRV